MRIKKSGDYMKGSQRNQVRGCVATSHFNLSNSQICVNAVTALEITWEDVGKLMKEEIFRISKISIDCDAGLSDWEYWQVQFVGRKLSLEEQNRLFDAVKATPEEQEDSVCEEKGCSINSLGMLMSEKLLQSALNGHWRESYASDTLWLLDFKNTAEEARHDG